MDLKKTISVVVPVYNEISNLDELYSRTTEVMQSLERYNYEIVLFDDGSTDGSREKIEEFCKSDSRVKAVFYSKNFGYSKSIFYCVQQARGDCAILLHADLQNPPELIPELVNKWENGAKNVLGIKNKSKENSILYFFRTMFYFIMNFVFGMKLIPHATEFELLDRSFIDILKSSSYHNPFLRSIISEYATDVDYLYYTQDKRNSGKTHFSVSKYYDFAVCGIVNMSKKFPRRVLVFGLICILISLVEFIFGFIPAAVKHTIADFSTALVVRLSFFTLSVGLSFAAVMSEYLISIASGLDDKPLITEEKRINY